MAVDVRTTGGDVSFRGYRGSARVLTDSGAIAVAGYCGNSLDARAGSGDIAFDADCAPPRLSLRSNSGHDPRADPARPATTSTPRAAPATSACAA